MTAHVNPPYTGQDGIEYRNCSHCGKTYPYSLEYFLPNTQSHTPSSICRECHRRMKRERYYRDRGRPVPDALAATSIYPPKPYARADGTYWRECKRCHEEKPYDVKNFWQRPGSVQPGSICWDCHRADSQRWHDRHDTKTEKPPAMPRTSSKQEKTAYRVIADPDPIGGFRRGALISHIEVEHMLPSMCFTAGTLLAYRNKRYVVEWGDRGQKLKELS